MKRLKHPTLGALTLEFLSIAVGRRSHLGLITCSPVDPPMAERTRSLVVARVTH